MPRTVHEPRHGRKKFHERADPRGRLSGCGRFGEQPSEDDLEAISIVETEIDADVLDHFEEETDTEVVAPGQSLSLLPGGTAYLRDGEPGTICSSR